MSDPELGDLESRVVAANMRLHAEQAKVYRALNPQLYNFYNQRRMRRDADFIVNHLDDGRHTVNILDLGCGTGLLSSHFLRYERCNVTALDLSAEMLSIFRESVSKEQADRLTLVNQEASEFIADSIKKETLYSAVVMSALLHHLVDIGEFVRSACKLIAPNGFLYVAFEPLRQDIDRHSSRYCCHRAVRSLDETCFNVELRLRGIKPETKGLADYQLILGGVDPRDVVTGLGGGIEVVTLKKFCVRRSSILAFVSGSIIGSENSFSLIARRVEWLYW